MRPVVVALAITGCGRVAFDPLADDGGVDPDSRDSGMPACSGPFSNVQPVLALNTPSLDWAPDESPDGLSVYFGSSRSGDPELYRATRASKTAPWGTPTVLTELVAAGDEEDNPTLDDNELELFYGRTNTYRTTRPNKAALWSTPAETALINGQARSSARMA